MTNWLLLKILIEDPLSSMMLLLRYSSDMLFCSSFALIYKSPTILLNTYENRLFSYVKLWVPDVHDMTPNILSSSHLSDSGFLFPDCE